MIIKIYISKLKFSKYENRSLVSQVHARLKPTMPLVVLKSQYEEAEKEKSYRNEESKTDFRYTYHGL